MWRQGDVFIMTVAEIPQASIARPMPHGTLVHGELTGHSHRIEDLETAKVFAGVSAGELFVEVTVPGARIVHEEHGPIDLPQGLYRVWRQREYSPEAVRYVVD